MCRVWNIYDKRKSFLMSGVVADSRAGRLILLESKKDLFWREYSNEVASSSRSNKIDVQVDDVMFC